MPTSAGASAPVKSTASPVSRPVTSFPVADVAAPAVIEILKIPELTTPWPQFYDPLMA